jgi:hypothetical protein
MPWPFIFVVLIEIFTKYFFGAEEKVSQFAMHQFATFISLIFTTLLCISIELLNYHFFQENSHSYISADFLGKDGCYLLIQLQVGDELLFEIDPTLS